MNYTNTKYSNIFIGDDLEIYKLMKDGNYHKLSKWIDNVGYYQVSFRENKKRTYIRVHRLIATTLIPNPFNLSQVNHKDGNKLNNSLSNLEWTTNALNTLHGYKNNLYHSKKRCHAVRAINKMTGIAQEFGSVRSCAEILRLNRKTITAILKQQKSNNYPYEFEYV